MAPSRSSLIQESFPVGTVNCQHPSRMVDSESDDQIPSGELRSNFLWFAVQFSINHGVVTTPLIIATSYLPPSVGYVGNAILNILTVVSAFVISVPAVGRLGLKGSLMFGMLFYCVYALMFAISVLETGVDGLQWIFFCFGSGCGGIAAGVLWTAQGGYFARTVDLLTHLEGDERTKLSAELASTFGFIYLGCEVCAKLGWTALDMLGIDHRAIACAYTAIGALSLFTMARALRLSNASPQGHWCEKVTAATKLWSDPTIFCLSGLNFTFGFSAAFMNGYVNGNFTNTQLGAKYVPMFAAMTTLVAAVFARVFGHLGAINGKGPVVTIGAGMFLCIGLSFFALGCCDDWKWALIVLYIFQGIGRAVYESTNKGVFADFFPDSSVGAFANCMLQVSLAFAICFFLSNTLKQMPLLIIVTCLSILTPIGYVGAVALRRSRTGS